VNCCVYWHLWKFEDSLYLVLKNLNQFLRRFLQMSSKRFNGNIIDSFIEAEVGEELNAENIARFNEHNAMDNMELKLIKKDDGGGLSVDVGEVYNELGNLVVIAKEMLVEARNILRDDETGESISGVAQMIGVINTLIREFSSVHKERLKFEQKLRFEEIKQQHRIELHNLKNPTISDDGDEELITYSQEDLIQMMADLAPAELED